jgi:hypothetical protein
MIGFQHGQGLLRIVVNFRPSKTACVNRGFNGRLSMANKSAHPTARTLVVGFRSRHPPPDGLGRSQKK